MTSEPLTLSIDIETRSTVNLRARPAPGAYTYFEDPHADVLIACYRFGHRGRWDDEIGTWTRGYPVPGAVAAHIKGGGHVVGWNSGGFERIAFDTILGPRYGWPVPKIEQWRDTMAEAAAMALPLALGQCAIALGLDEQKDKEGTRLINKFSKPRRARKGEDPAGLYWNEPEDHPEDFQAFCDYCVQDVRTECAIADKVMPLSPYELRVWHFDQHVNQRGLYADIELVDALDAIAAQTKVRLDKQIAEATGFQITATTQASALIGWLGSRSIETDSVDKNAIDGLLSYEDLEPDVRSALEARQDGAKTSTAKLASIKATRLSDGRVRGLMQYHGASTGRWAGRLAQPHNMPRGTGTVKEPDNARKDFLHQDARWIEMMYGRAAYACSDMIRSCFRAAPGKRLLAADFSSIEGRVTAWLAGEDSKLEVFRKNDRGEGAGAYETTAAGIYNVAAEDVTKDQRQVGKAAELGLGFAGGVMAFKAMADIYRVDMAEAYDPLRSVPANADVFEKAEESYEKWSEDELFGTAVLSRRAWIASEVTKVVWRAKHPAICKLWDGLQEAIFDAVAQPGTVASYGRIRYIVRRGFLWCLLPSGRCLAYGAPRIEDTKTPWGAAAKSVTVVGMRATGSGGTKWMRYALNKSVSVENVVQAVARDLLVHGMLKADEAGYPIVLHVHDEAVAELDEGRGSLHEFEQCLCDLPEWATGLPLVAEGYEAISYRK